MPSLQSLVTNACCFLPCQHQSTTLELTQKGSNNTINSQPLSDNISRLGNRDFAGPGHDVFNESCNKSNYQLDRDNKELRKENNLLIQQHKTLTAENEKLKFWIRVKKDMIDNHQTTIDIKKGEVQGLENRGKELGKQIKELENKEKKLNNKKKAVNRAESLKKHLSLNKVTGAIKVVKREVKGAIQHVKPGSK